MILKHRPVAEQTRLNGFAPGRTPSARNRTRASGSTIRKDEEGVGGDKAGGGAGFRSGGRRRLRRWKTTNPTRGSGARKLFPRPPRFGPASILAHLKRFAHRRVECRKEHRWPPPRFLARAGKHPLPRTTEPRHEHRRPPGSSWPSRIRRPGRPPGRGAICPWRTTGRPHHADPVGFRRFGGCGAGRDMGARSAEGPRGAPPCEDRRADLSDDLQLDRPRAFCGPALKRSLHQKRPGDDPGLSRSDIEWSPPWGVKQPSRREPRA
jgi:hypothetical protein